MQNQNPLSDIKEIRQMMERSTRFLSLSGLSGVFAGIYALVAAYITHQYLISQGVRNTFERNIVLPQHIESTITLNLSFIASITLIAAISTAFIFTARQANKHGERLFNKTSIRLAVNMFVPLIAGGIFCLALLFHKEFGLVAPATLVFYGLALFNAGKYTHAEVRYLGVCNLLLGLIACFFVGYGLEFWAMGFGVLHIVYGSVMWYKYERKK